MKSNIKKLVVLLVGLFIGPLTVFAAEANYEAGFLFYDFDPSTYRRLSDLVYDFEDNLIPSLDPKSITAGKPFGLAISIKTIGEAKGIGFAFYLKYNKDALEPVSQSGSSGVMLDILDTKALGAYPTLTWMDAIAVDADKGEVNVTLNDKTPYTTAVPVKVTDARPMAVLFFKLKEGATADDISFEFITQEDNPADGMWTEATIKTATGTANSPVQTVDYKIEKVEDTLGSLAVKNGSKTYTLTPTFNSDTLNYTLTVPSNVNQVEIEATAKDSSMLVLGAGTKTLNVGDNSYSITVNKDGTVLRTYKVDIKRLNNVSTLSSLSLTNKNITLSPGFNAGTVTYNMTVPYVTDSTTINATASSGATLKTTTGAWSLNEGLNTKVLRVEAEDCNYVGTVEDATCSFTEYTLNVTRQEPDHDKTLSGITVNNQPILPFSATQKTYTISPVGNSVTSLNVVGVPTSSVASATTTGNTNLQVGDNTITITVTAQDGTSDTYTVKVRRKSNVATLSGLVISSNPSGVMSPNFQVNGKSYKYVYKEGTTSVNINATATDSEASVKIGSDAATKSSATANITPTPGLSLNVVVTPEDGATDTYVINFEKEKSTDNLLKSLSVKDVNNKEYITTFNASTSVYQVEVEHEITSLNVAATANSNYAKINNGTNTFTTTINNLSFDSSNKTKQVITVSPEETTAQAKTYTIEVVRKKSSNANLTALSVGQALSGFNGTQNGTYNLSDVSSTTTSLPVSFTKENEFASVSITNNNVSQSNSSVTLVSGNNVIKVVVTSQDGTNSITHTINVKKQSNDATLSALTLSSTPEGVMSPNFSASEVNYRYLYNEKATQVNISATTNHSEATVKIGSGTASKGSVTGSVDPKSGSVQIVVEAEDGTSKTYTVTFDRELSTDVTLKRVEAHHSGTVYPSTYNIATKTYEIRVPNNVTSVMLVAESNSEGAIINSVSNEFSTTMNNLGFDDNSYTVSVAPEDSHASSQSYTIKVVREKSANANLRSLRVNNQDLTSFDGTVSGTYTIDSVLSSVSTIPIAYELENEFASVKVTNNNVEQNNYTVNLSPGDNVIKVEVTSQDGSQTLVQTVNVRKLLMRKVLTTLNVTSTPQGGFKKIFDPEVFDYTYVYPKGVTEIHVDGSSDFHPTSITGLRTYDVSEGKAVITVTPEDKFALVGVYTITFEEAKDKDSSLATLKVSDANQDYDISFSPTTFNYNLTVGSDVDKVTVSASANSVYAKGVSGTGEINLSPGSNKVDVIVEAEDSSTSTYTINITRTINTDASLATLEVDNVEIAGFSASKTNYDLVVGYDKTTINLVGKGVAGTTVSGNGDKTLNVGNNSFEIKVKPQSGDESTYTVNVYRKSNDASLTNLTAGSLVVTKTGDDYNVDVPYGVNTISLNATIANNARIVSPASLDNIDITSINQVIIEVEAEDNDPKFKKSYTVNINKLAKIDTTLSNLTIDGVQITGFNSTKTSYTISLDYDTTSFELNAVPTDANAVINPTSLGTKTFTGPSETYKFKVVAYDHITEQEYTIVVNRSQNSDNSISNLVVLGKTPTWNEALSQYEVSVDSSVLTIGPNDITADLPEGATFSDKGTAKNLGVGLTSYDFKVEAEDGSEKTYKVVVTRTGSSDNKLQSLTASVGTFDKTFDPDDNTYVLTVPRGTTSVDITALANFERAVVAGDGTKSLPLSGPVNIIVTPEVGTINTYVINVEYEKSADVSLSNLTIDGVQITGFNATKTSYTISLDYDTTSFALNAVPSDSNATIDPNSLGTKTFTGASETYKFTVVADDKTTQQEYTIVVNRGQNSDNSISNLVVLGKTPTWNSSLKQYEVSVDSSVLTIGPNDITADLPEGASFSDKGTTKNLGAGQTDYNFKVEAADGSEKTYKVVVTRPGSSDNKLQSLTASVGTFDKAFDPDDNTYVLTVPKGTTSVDITAVANFERAVVAGDGTKNLPLSGPVNILVTPEVGTVNTYNITVVYEQDSDATLASLSVEGYTLTPSFDSATLLYSIGNIETEVSSLVVRASANSSNARIKYQLNEGEAQDSNTIAIPDTLGEGQIKVIVTSEDNTSKTYVIKYNKTGLEKIVSQIHQIDANYVLTATPETDVATFKPQFDNKQEELFIYESDATTRVTSGYIGTGMIIKLERNGVVLDQKAIVILGETTGDGTYDIEDAVKIVNHYLGIGSLDNAYLKAADASKDDNIDIEDAVKVVNHYLGIGNLF